ncbi:GntR family transcriptional regulator [Streptomyces sp. enrichment culture]|uniref:GntR family transcriptional regulator n=1 Tax=Streptomyces sp. enrichment culture TaxID=1795815 RepID=UPI003F557226
MTTSRRTTKMETAYELLKQRISDGTYGPGYRLVIDQLARETGMSSIPWREAIRRLEAEGWLEMVPNVGARVAIFDTASYGQTMQVLARLEGYATAAALPRLTSGDLDQARHLNQQMTKSLDDFDPVGFTALNREFHFIFYERCGDAHLYNLIKLEWSRLDMIRKAAFSSVPGRARASVVEHEALLDLLGAPASFDAIEVAARQHKLNTLQAVQANDATRPGQ